MPGTYIPDLLAPVWAGLAAGDRSSWHNFAASMPVRNRRGAVVALNGWQMFVHVNALLAVADAGLILSSPPADLEAPAPVPMVAWAARLPHQGPDGLTYRRGRVYLTLAEAVPGDRVIVVLNRRDRVSPWSARPWYATKRTAILPGTTGTVDLDARVGYTVGGVKWLKRMRVRGPGFLGHPGGQPIKCWTVSTANGQRTVSTLSIAAGHPAELQAERFP